MMDLIYTSIGLGVLHMDDVVSGANIVRMTNNLESSFLIKKIAKKHIKLCMKTNRTTQNGYDHRPLTYLEMMYFQPRIGKESHLITQFQRHLYMQLLQLSRTQVGHY